MYAELVVPTRASPGNSRPSELSTCFKRRLTRRNGNRSESNPLSISAPVTSAATSLSSSTTSVGATAKRAYGPSPGPTTFTARSSRIRPALARTSVIGSRPLAKARSSTISSLADPSSGSSPPGNDSVTPSRAAIPANTSHSDIMSPWGERTAGV